MGLDRDVRNTLHPIEGGSILPCVLLSRWGSGWEAVEADDLVEVTLPLIIYLVG